MPRAKLLYKIKDGFDYSELVTKYGFYKTSPNVKNNPFYQMFLQTNWGSGFGIPLNGISINRNYGSVWLLDDESIGRQYWEKEIRNLVCDGVLQTTDLIDRDLSEDDYTKIEQLSNDCAFHNDACKLIANIWYKHGASLEELAFELFPQYIW